MNQIHYPGRLFHFLTCLIIAFIADVARMQLEPGLHSCQAEESPSHGLSAKEPWLPGTRSQWNGFDRYDFQVDGKDVLVVAPHRTAPGRPWLWHGEFFGHRPVPDVALLNEGFHIVAMKIPDLFGSPQAVQHWDTLYRELTEKHGFNRKPALIGVSRGGLYCYNWAAKNPNRVSCIYGDAPVCDLRSWPLGKGKGTGNSGEVPKLLKAYGVADVDQLLKTAVNPIDTLKPLAEHRVPLLHVYGDADTGVPWDENTGILADRYRELGGDITLIAKPGIGHVHGLDDSTPIIEFIVRHAGRALSAETPPIAIGSRRELFVDRLLIEQLDGAQLKMQNLRDEGAVLNFDQPWEGPHSGYVTMLKDGDRFRMYYRGISAPGPDGNPNERTCVAESTDGIHWTKPELNQYEFNGSRANNLVLADAAPVTHNFCPMIDQRPGVPAEQKYKAVGGTGKELFALSSADGVHWRKMQDAPILGPAQIPFPFTHLFDSQNLVFWSESENAYICYFRVWDGVRRVARSTSSDFHSWTPAVLMEQRHDDGVSPERAAPVEHLYTNQTSPYFRAPHIYLALAARFFEGRQVLSEQQAKALNVSADYFRDTSDAVLMSTRGGNVYDRTFLEGFLRPGIGLRNWVSRTNYPALNILQTGDTELSVYVNQDYAQPTAHVRRYTLRLDGFAALHADSSGGTLVTKPIIFDGERLSINFSTSAGGRLTFEITEPDGTPIPGFTSAECSEQIGNEVDRIVTWNSGSDVSTLKGRPVRLRIQIHDADLYSFRFMKEDSR